MLKIDIACGQNVREGFTGVDIWSGADIVCDLEKFPWPFEDSSVDEVFSAHYIEHTPDLVSFANELYRIMKVGATAELVAPYYSSIRAWQDPTHLRAISEATFFYFNKEWRTTNKLDHYPITVDFDFKWRYVFEEEWQDKDEEEQKYAVRHYINVVKDIQVILIKRNEVYRLLKQAKKSWDDNEFDIAASNCNKIIAIEDVAEAYLMIGEHALINNNCDTAIAVFTKATEVDSESIEAHSGLVRAYVNSGRLQAAVKYIKELGNRNADFASLLKTYL